MTPYRSEAGNERFNAKHSQCRSIIERCIGLLKSRFRCVIRARQLPYAPEKAARIINVSCLLHNICLKYNVPFDDNLFYGEDNDGDENIDRDEGYISNNLTNEAKNTRDLIKNSLQ